MDAMLKLQKEMNETFAKFANPVPKKAIEFLGEDVSVAGAKVYGFKAITVTTTGNGRKYTQDELEHGARGLSFRALNINHNNAQTLKYPENSTLLTAFDRKERAVIGTMRIADKSIQQMIEAGEINKLSIEQIPQNGESCQCYRRFATGACECEQHGVTFVGMALLTKNTPPGDPNTEIIKLETATSGVTITGPVTIKTPESAEPGKVFVDAPLEGMIADLISDPHNLADMPEAITRTAQRLMERHPEMSKERAFALANAAHNDFSPTGACCHCGLEYKSSDELDAHFKHAHPEDYERIIIGNTLNKAEWWLTGKEQLKCEMCDMQFDTMDEMGKHMMEAHKKEYIVKGEPFAGYKDFAACVSANQDKDDPDAYCGAIQSQAEKLPESVKALLKQGVLEMVIDNGKMLLFLAGEHPIEVPKPNPPSREKIPVKTVDGEEIDLGEVLEKNIYHTPGNGKFMPKDDGEAMTQHRPKVDKTKWQTG